VGAAVVAVAGVLTVSVGAGGAHASGRGAGGAQVRPGGQGGYAAHAAAVRRQVAAFDAAKARTLEALHADGMDGLRAIGSSVDVSPRRHGFEPVEGAAEVRKQWLDSQGEELSQQKISHLMVIARRLVPGSSTPQVRLIVPSVSFTEGRRVDEYITDQGETMTFAELAEMGQRGWSFHTKMGVRPLGARADIWWPAGDSGKTRDLVEALLEQDSVKARLLHHLYLPENHERELTATELVDEVGNSGDNNVKYNNVKYNNVKYNNVKYNNVTTRLSELFKAGVIKYQGGSGRESDVAPGRAPGTFRALTRSEIQQRDAKSILEMVADYPAAEGTVERRILNHLYLSAENRSRVFTPEQLRVALGINTMNDERGRALVSSTLHKLIGAGLVKRIHESVRAKGKAPSTYKAFEDGE
jgi:hypothetical protein